VTFSECGVRTRPREDPRFGEIWGNPTNTYSIDVNAHIPIWDGGERSSRIASSRITLDQTRLRIEEAETQIISNVQNEIRNIDEFQARALDMEQTLQLASDLSASSLALYREGPATILDVLQSFRREVDTAENLLDAYLGWRRGLLRMQELTYFDFELGMPVLERFGVSLPAEDN
jgi:outer membrane protein TolC